MSSLKKEIIGNRKEILASAERNNLKEVKIFGSVAQGNDSSDSDIDFLYFPNDSTDVLDVIGFRQDMVRLLGRDVDTLSANAVSGGFEHVLDEAIPV